MIIQSESILNALEIQGRASRFLFVSPHDDDAVIGAGLLIAQATHEGVPTDLAIVTDGSQGYCTSADREKIREIRKAETYAAYGKLGLDAAHIHFLEFPDCRAHEYLGRRPAAAGDPAIEGFTGLENSLTWLLRHLSPTHVFVPADTDIHPDHQAVHTSLQISLFHASGIIWPELGTPCALPELYEYPIYTALASEPELMIEVDAQAMQRKLDAVGCYVSQMQIEQIVEGLKASGPVEFLRNTRFALYRASIYKSLFEGVA